MIGMLNHTWEWAIIWPTVIIISMVKLHDIAVPVKPQYIPRHSSFGLTMSTMQWREYKCQVLDVQASLYMDVYLASMKGSKGGRKNIWSEASRLAHRYGRKDSAEIFSSQS